jgi:hypothetical protein
MAATALIHSRVHRVAEDDGSGFFYFKYYIRNFMTFVAILNIRRFFPVVTKAARFPLFHVCHGVSFLFLDVKDGIVAGFAIIADTFLVDMNIVIKFHFAIITAAESDFLYVYSIGK